MFVQYRTVEEITVRAAETKMKPFQLIVTTMTMRMTMHTILHLRAPIEFVDSIWMCCTVQF